VVITIEKLLTSDEVAEFVRLLEAAAWTGGGVSAGTLSAVVKNNQQLPAATEPALALSNFLLRKLGHHPAFVSAGLPEKIYPPVFNRYREGGAYGLHVDGAIMQMPSGRDVLRSDLSATLFLSDPAGYSGGELKVETALGAQSVKLAAGDMVLYPSGSLHQVTPVTAGCRVAAIFWVQSMVRDVSARAMLYELDQSVQALTAQLGAADAQVTRLSGIYHNLLRRWSEV